MHTISEATFKWINSIRIPSSRGQPNSYLVSSPPQNSDNMRRTSPSRPALAKPTCKRRRLSSTSRQLIEIWTDWAYHAFNITRNWRISWCVGATTSAKWFTLDLCTGLTPLSTSKLNCQTTGRKIRSSSSTPRLTISNSSSVVSCSRDKVKTWLETPRCLCSHPSSNLNHLKMIEKLWTTNWVNQQLPRMAAKSFALLRPSVHGSMTQAKW